MTDHPGRRESDRDPGEDRDPLRAIVVDDDANYRSFLVAILRRLGISVSQAGDGEEALRVLSGGRFDLALIDCQMPRMGGLQLIEHIRADLRLRAVYAVMLTGLEDVETKINALTIGFDDFMTKSSSEVEIAAKVIAARRLMRRQRTLDLTIKELYGLATRDELTGLYNRRFFFEEAARVFATERISSLILLDLDDFKAINDTYGHLAGDQVLRDVALVLLSSTRHEDVVARFGGDEFVIIIVNSNHAQTEAAAARIAAAVRSLSWTADDATFGVSATTGISSPEYLPDATLHQLLDACDQDLYKNKWLRKNPSTENLPIRRRASREDGALVEFPRGPGQEKDSSASQ